jgi:Glycerophosphoryl diester phosphodiesterase
MLLAFFMFFEIIAMLCFIYSERNNPKPSLLQVLYISLQKFRSCLSPHKLAFPYYSIFVYIFFNLPVLISVTLNARGSFPGSADLNLLKVMLLFIYTLISVIAFRGMFVIHYYIFDKNISLSNAVEASKALLHKHSVYTFQILLYNNLIVAICYLGLYYFIFLIVALFLFLTVEDNMVITVYLSVYPQINILLLIIFQMFAFVININTVSSLFTEFYQKSNSSTPSIDTATSNKSLVSNPHTHRHLFHYLLILVIAVGLTDSYITLQKDTSYLQNIIPGILVSSHRGNSNVAPENTLPALENAIIAGSDYAEIDVRQTKDGVLILLHDSNLMRTAGLDKNVEMLNLEELSRLDAGAWFSRDFIHTRIPTLEAAIKLCQGKIRLNIEVKADQNRNFEADLVTLIHKLSFENQCLISSMDYNILVKIKELDKNIKTGLILSAAYGDFYNQDAIDFFSIQSTHINRRVVENAHKAGKEIHAWTVNSVSELERMKSIGVDCIITDNPTLAKQILYQHNTGMSFIDLLKHLLNKS